MAKVISIELGHSVVKLCEMDYKVKKPKIYQCQEAITPEGAIQDGYIVEDRMKDLAYSIKETIARNGIKTKKVIFTVASTKIINREVTVPNVKESQIPSVVQANLSEYFPVSLADYEVTQSLVQTIAEGPDAGKHRVLVFAAEKFMLEQFQKLAVACNLDLVNVCCSGASIIEAARNAKTAGCQAIIKMEEKYSIISVVRDGVLLLQRSINYGVGEAMREVANQPSFATTDTLGVWRLITRQNCTSETVAGAKEAGRPEAREAVTATLNPLLSGIMRVFDYFGSHFEGVPIENVSIIGLGAQFIGVPETLGEALGIVCKKAGSFQDIDIVDADVKQKSDAYFSCIGACFSGEGFIHEQAKGGKQKAQINYVGATILIAVLIVVLGATMIVTSVFPYKKAKKENDQLKQDYETYKEGLEAYNELQGLRTINQKFLHGNSLTQHANDGLLNFLGELEKKLPEDVLIKEFVSDDEQCIITMVVEDKGTAAKTIETIRGFDSVMLATVETFEEVIDEDLFNNMTADSEAVTVDTELEIELEEDQHFSGEDIRNQITAGVADGSDLDITDIEFALHCYYYPIDVPEEVVEEAPAPAPAAEEEEL